MSLLKWDLDGQRFYETGVKNCVLYVAAEDGTMYKKAVAWNGITAITESPSGAEATPLYADDVKYLELMSNEEFGATIEAYTYPDEFAVCDGSAELMPGVKVGQQPRKTFGLSYITSVGNDELGNDYGKKLHIVYGCKAAPSEKAYATINDSPEAITFSWEVTTTPVAVTGLKNTSHIEIEEKKVGAAKWQAILDVLHGKDGTEGEAVEAYLPLPDAIKAILEGVTE
jgi:hypothetical protein